MEKEVNKLETQIKKETDSPFEGMSFKYPPVSKERFIALYEDYHKRCTAEELQEGIAASTGKHKDYETIRYEFEAIIMALNSGCRIVELKQERKDPQTGNLIHTIELTY